MSLAITLDGIDQAVTNLNYRNKRSTKFKLIDAIRNHYLTDESIDTVKTIDTDKLIQSIWDIGDSPELIKSKQKNFNSIKSSVNADLKKLFDTEGNPEGITISPNNTFEMSDSARAKLIASFSDSVQSHGDASLGKISEVLGIISELLSDMKNLTGKDASEDIKKVADLIKGLSDKIDSVENVDDMEVVDKERLQTLEEIAEEQKEDLLAEAIDEDDIEEIDEEPVDAVEDDEVEEVDEDDIEEIDEDDIEEMEEEPADEAEENEVEEVDEDDIDEVDEDDIEEIDEEPVDAVEDDEVEEVDEDDIEEIDEDDIEEIDEDDVDEADEEDVEAVEEDPLDEVDEDEVEEIDEDDIEEIDEDDIEEIDEDDIEEIDEDDIDEVDEDDIEEIDEDDIDEVDEEDNEAVEESPLDEVDEDEVEEIDEDDIEEIDEDDIEEVDEDDIEEIGENQTVVDNRLLAEEFNNLLGTMEKYFNEYIHIPADMYIVGAKSPNKNELQEQQFSVNHFVIGKFPVTNALFEVFIDHTGYKTTAEKKGFGFVYTGRHQKITDPKTGLTRSVWRATHRKEKVKGAFWYQPAGPGSSLHNKRNHPVVQVSIEDAMAFSAWTGKRLPSEFEWEAAARTTAGNLYPWGHDWIKGICNLETSAVSDTTAVDEYPKSANPLEIMDMLGNVLEWTADECKPRFAKLRRERYHIAKGGSWLDKPDIKLSSRFMIEALQTSNILGFRCVAD